VWSVSSRAASIAPSLIRSVRAKMGPQTLDLGLGQPDLPVPPGAREAVADAARAGRAPYGPNAGQPDARAAIARRYGVSPDEVMITCGVQEALAVAILGSVEPGDEVLVPDPGFPAYPNLVRAAGGVPVAYPLDGSRRWRPDLGVIEGLIGAKTRALVVNSPHNPTGAVLEPADAAALAALCQRAGVLVVSDEIYEDYLYGGRVHASPARGEGGAWAGLRLGGLSKSHHMMGWRVGWVTGPAEWISGATPLHQHLVTSAPTLTQAAVGPALEARDVVRAETMEVFRARRELAHQGARALEGVTFCEGEGAFYLFLDVRGVWSGGSVELAARILEQEDVMVVPGVGFGPGGEGHLRVAYTVEAAKLGEAFGRLARFFARRHEPGEPTAP
jgi:aspartate/methionine/tyrosine aminotransferase